MTDSIDKEDLARRLAPLYVKDFVNIARLCDETLDPAGSLLELVMAEAAAIGLPPSRQKAQEVIVKLCNDPEMWATHGCPSEHKLKKLEDELTFAFRSVAIP